MAINETIKTGRKFRIQLSGSDNVWKRLSFWTKASDVEFDDGTNAQDKLGTLDTDLLTTKNRLDTFESNLSTNLGKIATAITNQGVSTAATATVDTMVDNIATVATNKYNAGVTKGESNIKGSGDKVLTVPQAAYNSSKYNITDGYYTHVDATAVYNKGKTDGTSAGIATGRTYQNLHFIETFGERTTKNYNDSQYAAYVFVVTAQEIYRLTDMMASGTSYSGTLTNIYKDTETNWTTCVRVIRIERTGNIKIVSGDRTYWHVFGVK